MALQDPDGTHPGVRTRYFYLGPFCMQGCNDKNEPKGPMLLSQMALVRNLPRLSATSNLEIRFQWQRQEPLPNSARLDLTNEAALPENQNPLHAGDGHSRSYYRRDKIPAFPKILAKRVQKFIWLPRKPQQYGCESSELVCGS